MKKRYTFVPLLAAAIFFGAQAQAQKKTAKAAKATNVSAITKAPATEQISKIPDLTGIVDNTPKNDTPLEAVVRKADAVVEKTETGTIDWTNQYVEATGTSILDTERFKNAAQAKAMATRGAVVDAQRNLLETIKGVEVTGETTVENFMTTSDKVTTKVQGVIKGAYMVGPARTTADGAIEVTMRVPLYAKNGIASAVIEEVPQTIQQQARIIKEESGAVVSEAPDATAKPAANARMVSSSSAAAFTSENGKPIVFTMEGKTVDPSMFPVIFDQKGEVVLDMSKIYDPNKGQFPKILQASKDVLKTAGFQKGVEIIDLVQDKATGQLKLSDLNKTKINWGKIGSTAGKIASFLLMLI